MKYQIVIEQKALDFLQTLPGKFQRQIASKIDSLADNPFPSTCKKLLNTGEKPHLCKQRKTKRIPAKKKYFTLEGALQNSLREPNSIIFSLVRLFSKWHILLVIAALRKIRTNEKSANLAPNGVLQLPLQY